MIHHTSNDIHVFTSSHATVFLAGPILLISFLIHVHVHRCNVLGFKVTHKIDLISSWLYTWYMYNINVHKLHAGALIHHCKKLDKTLQRHMHLDHLKIRDNCMKCWQLLQSTALINTVIPLLWQAAEHVEKPPLSSGHKVWLKVIWMNFDAPQTKGQHS